MMMELAQNWSPPESSNYLIAKWLLAFSQEALARNPLPRNWTTVEFE